jgi:hypothetical protein
MNNNNENDQNDINWENLFGSQYTNDLNSSNTINDSLITELTNMITNRIINNNNNFFPVQQSNPPNMSNYNISDMIQNSLYQKNPYKKVTSEKGFSELKTIMFKDAEQETKECCITQDEFKEGQEINQLPCKHIFNKDAIHMWLKEESNSCPVCRYQLDFKEIIEKNYQSNMTTLQSNTQTENDTQTDSDNEMSDLEEVNTEEELRTNIENRRESILSNINRIIRNIQFVNEPTSLHRQSSFSADRDLQYALMASLNETQECNDEKNEDFLTHPDTYHDYNFNAVLSDIDSDDELNNVD